MSLSVVISTRNRAESLKRTLTSVKTLADEIVVIDNQSSDGTLNVAHQFGAKVFTRPNNLMLNVNKNFGFTKATHEWILCLDDDEEVPQSLADEIRETIKNAPSDIRGYWIPRKNIIFGKWIEHGIWWPDRQLRLFRKGSGKYPERHVHEYIEADGKTRTLTHAFIHHNYGSIAQYLSKMQDIYTESEVAKYVSSGYRIRWTDAIRFPASDFLKLYFAERGYKDGLHGLVLAILQAFYSFLIFAKLWEREAFREVAIPLSDSLREMDAVGKDVSYWMITAKHEDARSPIAKLWYRLMRKLRHTP